MVVGGQVFLRINTISPTKYPLTSFLLSWSLRKHIISSWIQFLTVFSVFGARFLLENDNFDNLCKFHTINQLQPSITFA